jgi:hypothetical protein
MRRLQPGRGTATTTAQLAAKQHRSARQAAKTNLKERSARRPFESLLFLLILLEECHGAEAVEDQAAKDSEVGVTQQGAQGADALMASDLAGVRGSSCAKARSFVRTAIVRPTPPNRTTCLKHDPRTVPATP